ncbi:vesicle transport protein SFT2B isoform X2 [Vigna unguiculata]|uniref:vesicle transport protein SFT2B isoform X2 n=1 Tax=Vigna unguiculata TaxID=3917 RepID=UPI001016A179|nr:vesicle transport protein SFT2B isoform X2 [Vigna unguiculata]
MSKTKSNKPRHWKTATPSPLWMISTATAPCPPHSLTNKLSVCDQRLYGFAICFAAGLTCTLLSMLVFFKPIKFAIAFTLGNLLSLGSTAFLIGPKRQVTMMLDPVRIYATSIYIASMIIALFCALYVHNKLLTFLALILEFGALVWYSLSYIPFARSMVSKIMASCFDTEF